jgi:hypothetical protein
VVIWEVQELSGHRPVLCIGGALADHDHVGVLAALFRPALVATGRTPRTQAAGELTAELTTALDEEGLVDGLVAHLYHRIVSGLEAQALR